jgi:hypothetical protein
MGQGMHLRAVRDEERQAVARLAQARRAQARGVERVTCTLERCPPDMRDSRELRCPLKWIQPKG